MQTAAVGHSRHSLSIDHLLAGLGWQAVKHRPGQQVVGTARVYQKAESLSRYSPWYEQTTNVRYCLGGHLLTVRWLCRCKASGYSGWAHRGTAVSRLRAEIRPFPSPGWQGLTDGCDWHVHRGAPGPTDRLSLRAVCLLLFHALHTSALASRWVFPWRRGLCRWHLPRSLGWLYRLGLSLRLLQGRPGLRLGPAIPHQHLRLSPCLFPASPSPLYYCPVILSIRDGRFLCNGSFRNLRSGHRGAYTCAGPPSFPVAVGVLAVCCLPFCGQSLCMCGPPHLKQPFLAGRCSTFSNTFCSSMVC